MRHLMTAGTLVCILALTGCGTDEADDETATSTQATATSTDLPSETATPEASAPPSEEPEPQGTVIEMTLSAGQVTPAGDRVEAAVGEPITFRIDADVAGELHVHSTPESEISFAAGTSEHEVTIDQPGIVEVELHEPSLVVVQLEVR